MDSEDKYVNNEEIALGDFAYLYNLERLGIYNISFEYLGTNSNNMLFVIYETNINGDYAYKDSLKKPKNGEKIEINGPVNFSKKILLCVFDSEGNGNLNVNIAKYNKSTFTIITDPTSSTSGSEVKLNDGILGGTTITKGYTRICYLGDDAPDKRSRYLYYDWYSSNNSVAKVSQFGTITAIGEGSVVIQCVYKEDRSIKATLSIIVVNYNDDDYQGLGNLKYGMDVRTGGTSSGSEVTSGLGQPIPVATNPEVTIHTDKTRLICLGDDSPTSSIQDFDWISDKEYIASVSSFGTITAHKVGIVIITGIYKYNPNYLVEIVVEVKAR